MTKSYFKEIVDKALKQASRDFEAFPDIPINVSFFNQLKDVKKTVINEEYHYTEAEADKKYSLGVLAIRNFDGYEDFDYKNMLIDISYGIPLYPSMSDE